MCTFVDEPNRVGEVVTCSVMQLNGRFLAMLELHELPEPICVYLGSVQNGTGETAKHQRHEKEQCIRPIDWHMPCIGDGNMQGEV